MGILDEINKAVEEDNEKVGSDALEEINAALGFTMPETPGLATEAGRGFMRSAYGTIGLLSGGPQALYGLATNTKENKQAGLERIADWAKTGQEEYPATVESFEALVDDPSPSNVARYIAGSAGELASMIPTLGGAGLGLGLARGIAQRAAQRAVEKAVEKGAISATDKAALSALAQNTEAKVLRNAALMGASAPAALMNTAESYAGLAERGGDDELGLTLAAGTAKTLLDTLAAVPVLGGLVRGATVGASRALVEKTFGKVLGNAVVGFMAEGSAEALQELIDVAAEEVVKPHNESAKQLAYRVIDAGVKGGLGGFTMGGIGGALGRPDVDTTGVQKQQDANQTGTEERERYFAKPEEIDPETAQEILQANREYARALDIRPPQDDQEAIESATRIRQAIADDIRAQDIVQDIEGRVQGLERGQRLTKDTIASDMLEEALGLGIVKRVGKALVYQGMPQETITRMQEGDAEVQRLRAQMEAEAQVQREDLPPERVGRAEFYGRPDIQAVSEFNEMGGPRMPEGVGSVPVPTEVPQGTAGLSDQNRTDDQGRPMSQAEVTYRDWAEQRQTQGLPIDEMAWVETFGQPMPASARELMWTELGEAPSEPNVSALRLETQEFYGEPKPQPRKGEVDWRDLKQNKGRVFQAVQAAPVEKKKAMAQKLRQLLTKWLGPQHYRLNFVNGDILVKDTQGNEYSLGGFAYSKTGIGHLAKITLDQEDPEGAAAHEAFHLAVLLGLVNPGEIQQLLSQRRELRSLIEKAQAKGWRPTTPIEEEITQDGVFQGLGRGDHELLAYSLEAYKFLKEHGDNKPAQGIVQKLFDRIIGFLSDMGLWFKQQDFVKNAVYDKFLGGELGQRPIRADQRPGSNVDLLAAINAWHGSPYAFERFSLDAIGTGEGAQVYGWGLYFAGKREIAEHYKKKEGAKRRGTWTFKGEKLDKQGKPARLDDTEAYGKMTVARWGSFQQALEANDDVLEVHYQRMIEARREKPGSLTEQIEQRMSADYRNLVNWLRANEQNFKEEGGSARLYSVELAPNEDEFLLFDKSLSEQPEKIKLALNKSNPDLAAITQLTGKNTGKDVIKALEAALGARETSKKLRELGVRGTKYLNGASRRHGEGDYNYVIFDEKDIEIKEILAAINSVQEAQNMADPGRQMSAYAKLFNHASMIAQKYPFARPLVMAIGQMNDTRNAIMFEAEQFLKPLHNLPTESSTRVNDFLIEGDKEGKWATKGQGGELTLGSLKLTDPKEIEAYEGFRKASLLMKDNLIKAFKQRMGLMDKDNPDTVLRKAAAAKGSDKIFYQRVSQVLQGLMEREGYMPHVRVGNHWITVKDAQGEVIHAEKFFMPRFKKEQRLREMRERLTQMYPQGVVSAPFRDTRGAMGVNLLGAVGELEGIASAYGLADGKEIDQFFQQLKLALATKGFRGHLRQRKNIPGYVTPQSRENYARNAFDTYLPSAANFISKQLHAPLFDAGLKAVQESRDPRLKEWADDLVKYISSPGEESSWIRMFAFHALLGFNLSSAILNITQIPIALIPFLKQFKGPLPDGVAMRSFKDSLKAFDVKKAVSNAGMHFDKKPDHLSQEEFKFLQDLERVGVIQPVLKQEYEAQAMQNLQRWGLESGPKAKGLAKMLSMYLKLSGGVFGISEQVNRVASGLTAYRLGQDAEFLKKVQPTWEKSRMAGTPLTAESFARWAIEETQGTFGKGNRPEFMRGNILSVATQFMAYPIMMIELLGKFMKEYDKEGFFKWGPGKMGALFMLGGLWVAGGLLAQPGADLARRFIELAANLFGKRLDLDYTMRVMLKEMGLGPRSADVLLRGPLRLGPFDISKRVDINPIKVEQLTESTGEALAGPAGGALAGMLSQVVKDYRQGNYGKMLLDLGPLALRNAGEAIITGEEGFKDSKGKVIKPASQVGIGEQIIKGMGFTPTDVAHARELRQFATNVVEGTKGKQQDFAVRLSDTIYDRANAIREGKPEKAAEALRKQQEIQKELVAYNKGRKPADMINTKSVLDSAQRQAKEALTGGYISPLKVKGVARAKRSEVQDILSMYDK